MLISTPAIYSQSDLKSKNKKSVKQPENKTPVPDTNTITPVTDGEIAKGDTVKSVTIDTLREEDNDEPLEHQIVYNARDSIRYESREIKFYLFGDAYVEYESMNLKAEFIEIDNQNNTMTAYGKKDTLGNEVGYPLFKDGAQEIVARKIVYNLKTKKGKIYDIMTKEGDLILLGSEVKKDSNNVVYMKNLQCIPCEHKDSRTIFKAKKAKIIPDDKIVTGPMYLEIGGVPTPLGLPFGFFPNTKNAIRVFYYRFTEAVKALGFI